MWKKTETTRYQVQYAIIIYLFFFFIWYNVHGLDKFCNIRLHVHIWMHVCNTQSKKSFSIKDDRIANLDEFDIKHDIKNTVTPTNVALSGQYKKSFAYYTFRQRLPNTLKTILKTLEQQTRNHYEVAETVEELHFVTDQIERLTKQLENNGQLEVFNGNEPDKEVWNSFITKLPKDQCSFYKTCWLYAECYMYRKLASYFEATNNLRNFDYFGQQKFQALKLSTEAMEQVATNTKNLENNMHTFTKLLKLNLWGNRCDLSITSGGEVQPTGNLLEVLDNLNANILIDHSEIIWRSLQRCSEQKVSTILVDFICDNAGFELFTDLLFAQYLVEHRLADIVRFNIKAIPWYVSDTTAQDIKCTLKYLQEHKSLELNRLGNEWSRYFADGHFQLAAREDFWTSPYEYYKMPLINPKLYQTLEQSSLLIFKGDLNYRKLLGDFNWDFCEKFETCLRGFLPTNLCTLRTIKGDLICDLQPGQAEELSKLQPDWMFTGEYGLIHYIEKEIKQ